MTAGRVAVTRGGPAGSRAAGTDGVAGAAQALIDAAVFDPGASL